MGFLTEMWVVFGAKTDKLKQGTREAESTLSNFGQQVNRIGGLIAGAFAVDRIASFAWEATKLAGEVQGVGYAFDALNKPGLLNNLRIATKGTVSDLDLMKSAVQANNFQIPLEQLGSLLRFAQLRAQQTGQSVDYLVQSIVLGIGRKSPLILDNLGISAVRLRELLKGAGVEMQSVGDIAAAVGRVATEEMAKSGEAIDTATTSIQRMNAEWQNTKAVLGESLQPTMTKATTWLGDFARKFGNVIRGWSWRPTELLAPLLMGVQIDKQYEAARAAGKLEETTGDLNVTQDNNVKLTEEQIAAAKKLREEQEKLAQQERARFADLVARGLIKTPGLSRSEVNSRIGSNSLTNPEQSKIQALTPDGPQLEEFNQTMDDIDARWEQSANHANNMAQMIVGAFSNVTDMKSFANAVKDAARQVIMAVISETVALNVAKAVREGKTWYGAVIQGALAASATSALFAAIPSFSKGGMVTGPTLAMVGDNPSGKEYMIPSELLQGIKGNGGMQRVEFVLRGQDLYGSTKKYERHLNNV